MFAGLPKLTTPSGVVVTEIVDMPDGTIDLLFRFLRHNTGVLSKRGREKEFAKLTDERSPRSRRVTGMRFLSSCILVQAHTQMIQRRNRLAVLHHSYRMRGTLGGDTMARARTSRRYHVRETLQRLNCG